MQRNGEVLQTIPLSIRLIEITAENLFLFGALLATHLAQGGMDLMMKQRTKVKKRTGRDYQRFNRYTIMVITLLFICALGFFASSGCTPGNTEPGDNAEWWRNVWFILFISLTALFMMTLLYINCVKARTKFPGKERRIDN